MGKRITIILDDDLEKKLRTKQAILTSHSSKTVSFSRVLNNALRDCMR